MKKIIAITLCMICFLALICIPASAERADHDSIYYVRVETNPIGRDGAHIDTVYVPHGEKCTLTIDESVKDFVFWNVHGEYEIVAGDYEAKSFTIRPLSDIVAVATYQEAVPHIAVIPSDKPPDMISPKTGENTRGAIIAAVLLFINGGIIMAVVLKASKKKDKPQDPQEYYDTDTEISDDLVLNYDIIHIISDNFCKTILHNPVFDEPITLGDCEEMIDTLLPIIVLAENPLDGAVFRIGNHKGRKWEKIGSTEGYA